MQILAGAGIKAMLLQLSDEEIDEILARTEPTRYTPLSIVDKAVYKEKILELHHHSIVYDRAVFS
jgi:hypothetical protein